MSASEGAAKRQMTRPEAALNSRSDNVEMTPASKLRAESRRDPQQRQLLALAGALLLAMAPASALAQASAAVTAADELRAAKLMEATLFARQAGAEEWRKMERIYVDLAAKYPRDAAIPNAHAELLWSLDQPAQAVEKWLAAEQLDPHNATVLDHLGGSSLAAGDAKKAAAYFARAFASAPAKARHHFNYANVTFLFRHELLDPARPNADAVIQDALAHFREAARLEPLDPEYARAFAETFYLLNPPDWPAALRAWQHFYEISPQKDFALLNLARVHMKLGNKPEARESLARIQNPEFDRLKARLNQRIDSE